MDSNIIISGTSFLLPKNEAWNVLGPTNKIIFPDYGDWRSSIKMCKKNEYLVFIIFISDLYGIPSETNNKGSKAILDLIKVFLKTIEQHLKKSSSPTIVTFSSWRPESIIRLVGNKNYFEKIYNILTKSLNELKASYPNLYLFDLDKQLGYHGFAEAFDNRNWYLAHCRLSTNGLNILAQSLAKIIERI